MRNMEKQTGKSEARMFVEYAMRIARSDDGWVREDYLLDDRILSMARWNLSLKTEPDRKDVYREIEIMEAEGPLKTKLSEPGGLFKFMKLN